MPKTAKKFEFMHFNVLFDIKSRYKFTFDIKIQKNYSFWFRKK